MNAGAAAPVTEAEPSDPPRSDEEYDGIRELDNPQPRWFQLIFAATVVFAGGYWYWYQWGPGISDLAVYEREYAEYRAHRSAIEVAEGAAISEDSLTLMASDTSSMARGKAVFLQSCASCHTENGRGLVGPNLTDDYQIHGSSRSDIYATVRNGVPEKGMIPWGPVLPPTDLASVTVYVASLRHSNVAGGKPPQGEKVAPFSNKP